MANFTLETNRNTAITNNIPRITFQLPQSTPSGAPSTINPVYFCQIGCQLEFQFKNITSAQLKNNGTYFTIIPTGNSDNYINWNGSGVSGQDMTRFDLKEINFSAPARDVVGSITYNRSIQFFFTFVNSNYPNIMIVITVIGQANNVGTAQSDGFVLLNSLSNQIPIRNEIKTVNNLSNVNLGFLLPPNKSFFSTLISNNTIQYISMTRIIDIPNVFLDNMISRVIGSTEGYQTKVNQYIQNIPTNPQGTIIFYTENVKPINSDQAYVCNSNCDRVIGDATLLQPTFGTSTTVRSTTGDTPTVPGGATDAAGALPKEKCKEENVYPGARTNVKINSASSSTNLPDNSNSPEVVNKEIKSSMVEGILIALFLIIIIVGSVVIIIFLFKATDIYGFRSFFTRDFWKLSNSGWITIGLLGLCSIIAFTAISLDMMIKQFNVKSIVESEKTDKDKEIENQKPWIFLIIGLSIYIICLCILIYKSWRNISYSNSILSRSFDESLGRSFDESFNGSFDRSFDRSLLLPPIRLDKTRYKSVDPFNTQISKILGDYDKSRQTYLSGPSSQGVTDYEKLLELYKNLPASEKKFIGRQTQFQPSFFNKSSEFGKNLRSGKTNMRYIDSLKKYDSALKVDQNLLNYLKQMSMMNKNDYIKTIIRSLKIGDDIPADILSYIK